MGCAVTRLILVAAALVVFAAMPLTPAGASPSPAPVKYYIVPPPGNGPAESLFTIAAQTLGDGNEWAEIFSLNEGRLEPDGGRFTNPRLIEPGWILQLPANATGPEVRVGALPAVRSSSPSAATPTSPSAATHRPSVVMVGGAALLTSVGGVLALGLIRRRAYHGHHRRTTKLVIQPDHLQLLPAVAEPAPTPVSRSRQFVAMRLFVLAMAVPILFGLITASAQLALHGYGFFIFRSAGTGATSSNPLPSPTPHKEASHVHRRTVTSG